jgi:hypothetical protein
VLVVVNIVDAVVVVVGSGGVVVADGSVVVDVKCLHLLIFPGKLVLKTVAFNNAELTYFCHYIILCFVFWGQLVSQFCYTSSFYACRSLKAQKELCLTCPVFFTLKESVPL